MATSSPSSVIGTYHGVPIYSGSDSSVQSQVNTVNSKSSAPVTYDQAKANLNGGGLSGANLSAAQTSLAGAFGMGGSSGSATPPPAITTSLIKPNPSITLPAPGTPDTTGTGIMATMNALGVQNAAGGTKNADGTITPAAGPSSLKDMLTSMYQAPASTEDLYTKTAAEAGIQEKTARVNALQASLTGITNQATADKLSLTGTGRGIPEPIIGGQQAEIDKEAAIRSLPVAAQLAAAQNDLTSAKEYLSTVFQIRVNDANAKTTYANKIIDTVFQYATDQQKEQLADRRTQENQTFQVQLKNMDRAEQLAMKAIENGQPSLAAQLTALDPTSPTYKSEVSALTRKLYIAPKATGGSAKAPTTGDVFTLINGYLSPKATIPGSGGVPMLQAGTTYFTKAGFQAVVDTAAANGVKRTEVIDQYAPYLNPNAYSKYGLTGGDIARLTNTSKEKPDSSGNGS